jgi:hypothetical protein
VCKTQLLILGKQALKMSENKFLGKIFGTEKIVEIGQLRILNDKQLYAL